MQTQVEVVPFVAAWEVETDAVLPIAGLMLFGAAVHVRVIADGRSDGDREGDFFLEITIGSDAQEPLAPGGCKPDDAGQNSEGEMFHLVSGGSEVEPKKQGVIG